MKDIKRKFLHELDIEDEFFNSLKEDYFNFSEWFNSKKDEMCYMTEDNGKITSFLFFKIEDVCEDYSDFIIPFPPEKRLKICTFKVTDNGKGIGKEFLNIIYDEATSNNIKEIYLTVFEKQKYFIEMMMKNGFSEYTRKRTLKADGKASFEKVLVRRIGE